jgi:hypothetical protein
LLKKRPNPHIKLHALGVRGEVKIKHLCKLENEAEGGLPMGDAGSMAKQSQQEAKCTAMASIHDDNSSNVFSESS